MSPDLMGFVPAPPVPGSPPGGAGVPFLLAVLDVQGAADYLHVPAQVVLDEAEAGRLPGQKLGTEWRFLVLALTDWLRAGTGATAARDRAPAIAETDEEHEAFLANIRAGRDEIDRATGSGKYAPE